MRIRIGNGLGAEIWNKGFSQMKEKHSFEAIGSAMEQAMTREPEAIRRLKAECATSRCDAWDARTRQAEIEAFRRRLNATVGADVVRCFQIVPSFHVRESGEEGRAVAMLLNRHLPIQVELDAVSGRSGFYMTSYDIYGRALRNSEGNVVERVRFTSLGQALLAAETEFRRLEERQAALMGRQATDVQVGTMPEEVWLHEQLGRWVRIEPEIPPAPGVFPTAAELRRFLAEQREQLSPGFDMDVDRQIPGMDSARNWRK
jgi:hypothetical protein